MATCVVGDVLHVAAAASGETMKPDHQEFIRAQLARMDKYEAKHLHRIEQETRGRFVVNSEGVTEIERIPEGEYEELFRLHNLAMKVCLMWESRYLVTFAVDELDWATFGYVHVVIDHRLGLRKTLSYRDRTQLPKWARARIREQVDGILAALDDIDTLTS